MKKINRAMFMSVLAVIMVFASIAPLHANSAQRDKIEELEGVILMDATAYASVRVPRPWTEWAELLNELVTELLASSGDFTGVRRIRNTDAERKPQAQVRTVWVRTSWCVAPGSSLPTTIDWQGFEFDGWYSGTLSRVGSTTSTQCTQVIGNEWITAVYSGQVVMVER